MVSEDHIYELHADVCRILANPARLRLINLLRGGERSLQDLVAELRLPLANVSQHLNIMRTKNVVVVRRDGVRSHYRLRSRKIVRAFDLMREVLRDNLDAAGEVSRSLSVRRGKRGAAR